MQQSHLSASLFWGNGTPIRQTDKAPLSVLPCTNRCRMERRPVYEPFTTSFGAVAARCQAKSKRSGLQCRKPAMRSKSVCRTHGGASTGAKTRQGRERCAQVKTVHGWETREIRRMRAEKLRELRELEGAMLALGMLSRT